MNRIEVQFPIIQCIQRPIIEVDPKLSTVEKQNLYEFKARVKVSDAVGIIEIAKHMKKGVPPQKSYRYLQDVPIEDLIKETIQRENTEFLYVVNEDVYVATNREPRITEDKFHGLLIMSHNNKLLEWLRK